MSWFGALLRGVGQVAPLVGSVLGFNQARKSDKRQEALAREQMQFQKDLIHNQVSWRVADAKRAGIHPLYAIGGGSTFSPVMTGGDSSAPYLSEMGQDIGRAVGALQDRRERIMTQKIAMEDAQLARGRADVEFKLGVERASLENQLLASQLARLNAPGTPPPFPDVVNSGATSVVPAQSTASSPANLAREAGSIRDYGFVDVENGGLGVVPSYDIHERMEDNWIQQFGWFLRNQLVPFVGGHQPPSVQERPLPSEAVQGGANRWAWNVGRQAFLPFSDRHNSFVINGRRAVRRRPLS